MEAGVRRAWTLLTLLAQAMELPRLPSYCRDLRFEAPAGLDVPPPKRSNWKPSSAELRPLKSPSHSVHGAAASEVGACRSMVSKAPTGSDRDAASLAFVSSSNPKFNACEPEVSAPGTPSPPASRSKFYIGNGQFQFKCPHCPYVWKSTDSIGAPTASYRRLTKSSWR